MLWLDKKYNQLLPFKTGTKSRVDIGKEADRLLKKGTDSSIISIHNHPGSLAFSPEDLSVALNILPSIRFRLWVMTVRGTTSG